MQHPAADARPIHRPLKRAADRALAAALLVGAAPLLLAAAGAVALEGRLRPSARGPFLYRERRISQGSVFWLYKLRTVDRDAYARALAAGQLRPFERPEHLTVTGRYLKKWYLDELPQLWSVLRGEISFVGTRPYPVADYEAELRRGERRKQLIPAGLTGLTQIHKGRALGRSDVSWDYEYYDRYLRYSAPRLLVYDLGIMVRTVRTVFEGKGL